MIMSGQRSGESRARQAVRTLWPLHCQPQHMPGLLAAARCAVAQAGAEELPESIVLLRTLPVAPQQRGSKLDQ